MLRVSPRSQPNDKLRAHAIRLFGALSRFGEGPCKAMLYDQIQANLVSLILHLNDTDAEVKKVGRLSGLGRGLGEGYGTRRVRVVRKRITTRSCFKHPWMTCTLGWHQGKDRASD